MPPNIVLLSIDALRADHLSCYGYDRETTPNIDAFASDAIQFENAFSASSHTREALPALLTGQYPGVAVADDFSLDAATLATHLKDSHVAGAFHSNPYVSRAFGFDRDFDTFDDDLHLGRHRLLALFQRAVQKFVLSRGEYHARADQINDRAFTWIDSLSDDQPFFLWNHYMDVHGPYNPPAGYNQWADEDLSNADAQTLYNRCTDSNPNLTAAEQQRITDLYDGEIRYLDAKIGKFLDRLRERDLLTDSLLLITADHGELLGEYGSFAHPRYVYPELTHVPLLIDPPERQTATIEVPVSTLDVVPTILDIVHERHPGLPGTSLLELIDESTSRPTNRQVFSSARGEEGDTNLQRFAVHDNIWTVCGTWGKELGEITDVQASRRDEAESFTLADLPADAEAHVTELHATLTEHATRWGGQSGDRENIDEETDPEIERRLEALGYK